VFDSSLRHQYRQGFIAINLVVNLFAFGLVPAPCRQQYRVLYPWTGGLAFMSQGHKAPSWLLLSRPQPKENPHAAGFSHLPHVLRSHLSFALRSAMGAIAKMDGGDGRKKARAGRAGVNRECPALSLVELRVAKYMFHAIRHFLRRNVSF
jgi:hypothetical protein